MVAVAYQVVRWEAPIAVKYAVIAAGSLILTVLAYDLLVRRTRLTRFLFGLRPAKAGCGGAAGTRGVVAGTTTIVPAAERYLLLRLATRLIVVARMPVPNR
ncbi:hypothetical protein GCM10020219_099590 [Nonomuraea dietziae]